METKYKHRLIGVIVIAASAIIIIPALFKSSDNATSPSVVITEQTPPAPTKPTSQYTVQQSNQTISTVQSTQNIAVPPAAPIKQTNTHSTAQNVFSTPSPTSSTNAQAVVNNQTAPNVSTTNVTSKQINAAEQNSLDETVAQNDQNAINSSNKPAPAKIQNQENVSSDEDVTTSISQSKKVAAATKTDQTQNLSKEKIAALEAQSLATETASVNQKSTSIHAATNTTEEATTITIPDGSAWVVQLGSFSNLANAKALEQKLQAKGFNAYIQKAKTAHGVMAKVLIGPESQKSKAQEILSKLKQEMDLKGVIVPYLPV